MTDQTQTNNPKPGLYALHDDEHATVLAALRLYQQKGMGEPYNRSNEIHEIATNGGEVFSSLDDEGIDKLYKSLSHKGLTLAEAAELISEGPAFAVVQEGGSSSELYISSWPSREEAEAFRVDCATDGAYRTSPVVEIPAAAAAMGELLYEAAGDLLDASHELELVDVKYFTIQLGAGTDVPLQEGGTGPDEPVWHFTSQEDRDAAAGTAKALGLAYVTGEVDDLPEGADGPDELADFTSYANMQVA